MLSRLLRRAMLIGPIVVLAIIGACRSTDAAIEKPRTAQHSVHSEELMGVMRELEALAHGRLPQELDPNTEVKRRIAHVRDIANRMAQSAVHIPDVLEGVALDDRERAEFVRLASELRQQALSLAADAPSLPVPGLVSRMDALDRTCMACHTRFRILPAPEAK